MPRQNALSYLGISQPYVLTVGALQERKNLGVLFEAYAALRARWLAHRLVVVGKKAWKYEGTFRRLAELGPEDDMIFTGYLEDEDLPAVYAGAPAFVFPSLYEGFGLPPLEAMACGVPVITSNTSSLPEVVGDAGLMLDPHDVPGFTEALARPHRRRSPTRPARPWPGPCRPVHLGARGTTARRGLPPCRGEIRAPPHAGWHAVIDPGRSCAVPVLLPHPRDHRLSP